MFVTTLINNTIDNSVIMQWCLLQLLDVLDLYLELSCDWLDWDTHLVLNLEGVKNGLFFVSMVTGDGAWFLPNNSSLCNSCNHDEVLCCWWTGLLLSWWSNDRAWNDACMELSFLAGSQGIKQINRNIHIVKITIHGVADSSTPS